MKNLPFTLDTAGISPMIDTAETNLFPLAFQEQILNIYWIKKDLEHLLHLQNDNISDSLTDVAQLLEIIEAKAIRILKNASKNDAELQKYWGF